VSGFFLNILVDDEKLHADVPFVQVNHFQACLLFEVADR
jgi:hypothetical protein